MPNKFQIDYSPRLSYDFQRAISYYKLLTGNHKIGKEFLKLAKTHIKKLEYNALHNEIKYGEIRCLLIPKFPFRVHYRINGDKNLVYIEAVIHTSESPESWPQD
jgi:hypothetical protein